MVEIPVVEGEGWVAKIYRCRHVTRIKGDLSPLLNLSQDPESRLVRLAERDEGDEVGVLIGGLSDAVLAQGLFSAKQ
jgi:hypothetical protein